MRNCTCFNLRAATRYVTKRFDELLAPSGILSTQFSMLNFIDQAGPCGMADLAEWMVMDVSTVTRNLNPLVSAGHITIRPSASDGRRKEITLTAKGRRTLGQARKLWNIAQDEIIATLGKTRYAELLDVLAELRPTG